MFRELNIKAQRLSIRRGGRLLFSDLDVVLHSGEALLLRGANGTGKSTLLRILAGLLSPETGRLDWSVERDEVDTLRHYFGHLDGLQLNLTVYENLRFFAEIYGAPNADIDEALDQVGLLHCADMQAGALSAGQKRRVAFSRLLSVERPVWLLDEPTSALDAASSAKFEVFMTNHVAKGGIVVAATHHDLDIPDVKTIELSSPIPVPEEA